MTDDEGRRRRSRILRCRHAEAVGLQCLDDIKRQFCRRRVVQHVPGTQQQTVLTIVKLGQAEAHATTAVVAKVVAEVAVQVIGLRHLAVDNQLDIMADAAARGIDAVLVRQLCIEIRCGVNVASVRELRTVQVAPDIRSDAVVGCQRIAGHGEGLTVSMSLNTFVVADGIGFHHARTIGIADILRQRKGQHKPPVAYAVATTVKGVETVAEAEGRVNLLGTVHATSDELLHILHSQGHHAIE